MGFFDSIFGGKPSSETIDKIDFGKYFYLMNYEQHYGKFLSHHQDKKTAIIELYIFRAWFTNFSFRLFSSHEDTRNRVSYNIVNLARTLGLAMLHFGLKIDIPDFDSYAEIRWHEYDSIVTQQQGQNDQAALRLSEKVCTYCGIEDIVNRAEKTMLLTMDLVALMKQIKEDARTLGL